MNSAKAKETGRRIKEIREQKKLTQAQVAKKAGIKTNYFAVIERGEVTTNFEYLQNISQALGVDINKIVK